MFALPNDVVPAQAGTTFRRGDDVGLTTEADYLPADVPDLADDIC
jgi:hypothetical protein